MNYHDENEMKELLRVDGVSRRYGTLEALKSTSFALYEGELLAFVGPSGAGKTTLLRILAGIDPPDTGTISVARQFDRDHPAILVFQDYLLFPHLSVFENVAFGLRSRPRGRKMRRVEIRARVFHYLDELDIRDKAEKRPAELSGGQKQRVALARALVMEPRLLLLDEPFASLDKALKRSTARFIRDLQREFGVTMVVVSHDLEETSEVADRIGVIAEGSLQQIGTFRDVYTRPKNLSVAEMFGPVNVIPVNMYYTLPSYQPSIFTSLENDAVPVCRPESLVIAPDPAGPARVIGFRLRAGVIQYEIESEGWLALASTRSNGIAIGDRVSLAIEGVIPIPVRNKGDQIRRFAARCLPRFS